MKARGRPPSLGKLDDKLVNVLLAIRQKGGTINCHIVCATATALLKVNPSQTASLCTFDMPRSWIVSIYKRIGFVRRAGTTSRPPVPMGVYQECRLDFLSGINKKMKEHSIPPDLVLNANQTPSTYVFTSAMTMAKREEKCGNERFGRQESDHAYLYCQPDRKISSHASHIWRENHSKSASRIQVSRWILHVTEP